MSTLILFTSAGMSLLLAWASRGLLRRSQAWRQGELADYQPQSITLEVWLERWCDSLGGNNIAVAIFPQPDEIGLVEEASELADALIAKLEQLDAQA